MIEKLKQFADSVKGVLLFIVAPLIILFAYIANLREKVQSTQDELNQSKAAQQLATVIEKKVEDEKQSIIDERDYDSLRTQYVAEHPSQFQETAIATPTNSEPGTDPSTKA